MSKKRQPEEAENSAVQDTNGADDGSERETAEQAAEGAAAEEGSEKLEELRKKADEYYDRFLRSQAELQNVLKRHQRDRSEWIKYGGEAMARDLLAVIDDLERALAHRDEAGQSLAEGVELVLKGLLGLLERHGVERIEALGEPFDPAQHEAVQTVETDDQAPDTVVEEHRAGYRIHGRLLRPAMVAVAKAQAGGENGGKSGED